MLVIRKQAYARAGLIGNPSDGYNGRTISVIVRDFRAQAVLYEWEDIEIVLSEDDRTRFSSLADLARDVRLHGYYGGARLVKATLAKFFHYCTRRGLALHNRNFSIRYQSNIPRQVGLAGSSAIIVATLRCLMDFYNVSIPRHIQPSLALSVETDDLKIPAGLQDRVIQVYEGVVFMDFAKELMRQEDGFRYGVYQPLNPALLPPLYIAYSADESEPTEVTHSNLRMRYEQGEREVVEAMQQFAELTVQARAALERGDHEQLGKLMNANFDLRRKIIPLAPAHIRMVETARAAGASAKFAGSGGAIIGTYRGDDGYARLGEAMTKIGCRTFRPRVCP